MIIICNKPGQLGNRIFVFAHCIAFAKEYGVKIINPAFDEYTPYFITTKNDLLSHFPTQKNFFTHKIIRRFIYLFFYYLIRVLRRLKIKNRFVTTFHIDWHENLDLGSPKFIQQAKTTRYIFIQGWDIRDNINFQKHADFIRTFFIPLPKHQNNVDNLIGDIKQQCDILVGVHIRQGDYNKFEGGKYFYSSDDYKNTMKKAMMLFQNKKIVFLICSNEKLNGSDFSNLNFIFGTGQEMEDLYSFAQCNYLIGPPSTYTMWASFYGDVPLFMVRAKDDYPKQLGDFKIILQ